MLSNSYNTDEQTEIDLVREIGENPNARAPMIKLAQYLELKGSVQESASIYRGNLSASLKNRHNLDPYPSASTTEMASCSRQIYYGVEKYTLEPPLNIDKKRNSIFNHIEKVTKPEFVDIIKNCTLLYDGKNRLYLDELDTRNTDHSSVNSFLLMQKAMKRKNIVLLKGVSILLASHNASNFYHWHFDRMSHLCLAEAAGYSSENIDHILIDESLADFQLHMLLRLGFKRKQIRFFTPQDCHFQCERLIMVRAHNNQGMHQSNRHINWIRGKFLKNTGICKKTDTKVKPTHIAIVRGNRGFSQKDEIYSYLSNIGYSCIDMEKFQYEEQVSLFSNATHIVSPHGAALSLLVYCKPDTVVHEFYSEHIQPCFWSISSSLGLRYNNYNCSNIVDGSLTRSNKNLEQRQKQLVDISAKRLSELIS